MRLIPKSWVRATVMTIALTLTFAGLAVMVFLVPLYEASVRIKVQKEVSDIPSFGVRVMGVDAYWVREQFQALRSKAVVLPVATNLGLAASWVDSSFDDGDVRLPGYLIVQPFPSSSLVQIRYRSNDAHLCAKVANAIATAYQNYRLAEQRAKKAAGISILEQLLRDQDAKITEREHELDAASLKQVRERLSKRLQVAKAAPIKSGVELIDLASPPARPIREPRKIGLTLIGLGGVLAAFEFLTRTRGRIEAPV